MVTTSDFPQADRLEQVGKVALAVANGCRADDEIEDYIGLGSAGRQGRYYRRAAEILGLISTYQNHSSLTPLGHEYSTLTSDGARTDFLAQCLLETPVFKAALDYIYKYKPSESKLKVWFRSYYPGESSTANRRFVTFRNYLYECNLVGNLNSQIVLSKFSGALTKKQSTGYELLTGNLVNDKPVKITSKITSEVISMDIDAQKMERANQIHWNLITAKSTFLDHRGWSAYENEHIDLYASSASNNILIYEMKSISETNLISQVRKAVAQLYEYRFVFSVPDANLCIVTNAPIPKNESWLTDYLTKDRKIAHEWSEDFENFECHEDSRAILGEFAP